MTTIVRIQGYPLQITHLARGRERGLKFRPREEARRCWNWLSRGIWPGVLDASEGTIMYPAEQYSQEDMEEIRSQYLAGKQRMTWPPDPADFEEEYDGLEPILSLEEREREETIAKAQTIADTCPAIQICIFYDDGRIACWAVTILSPGWQSATQPYGYCYTPYQLLNAVEEAQAFCQRSANTAATDPSR
jgi:hypothetical protein